MRRVADAGQGDALQRAQYDAQSRTMGEHGHSTAVMGRADAVQGGDVATQQILCRLAALHAPQIHPAVEVVHLLRVQLVQLVPRMILPHAHADLPEGRLQMERQRLGQPNGPGSDLRTVQVAGVHRIDVHILKPLAQRVDLLIAAVVGDQPVVPAVGNAVEIRPRSAWRMR